MMSLPGFVDLFQSSVAESLQFAVALFHAGHGEHIFVDTERGEGATFHLLVRKAGQESEL